VAPRARRLRPASARQRRDDEAVSELIATVLLVVVTVVILAGLAEFFLKRPAPEDQVHAELFLSLDPGTAGWGSGDEAFVLEHHGGEKLDAAATQIRVLLRGQPTTYSGGSLGSAFTDGSFTIGETWRVTRSIPAASPVEVQVIVKGALMFQDDTRAG